MGCTPNHIWYNVIFGENKTSSTGRTLELRLDIQINFLKISFFVQGTSTKTLNRFYFCKTALYFFYTTVYIYVESKILQNIMEIYKRRQTLMT